MPDWTYNKLVVSGTREAVAAFVEAVEGVDDDGAVRQLSLAAIDPMPPEYSNGARWSDSEEFAALKARFEASTDKEQMEFVRENRGFASVLMAPGWGFAPEDEEGWLEWRLQHWGTKWDLPAEGISLKVNKDGRKATFECDSANDDIAPAVATAAKKFPELAFTLRSKDAPSGKTTVRSWENGDRLPER